MEQKGKINMVNCKPQKKYPYRTKKKMCYTSPTSGRVRCGYPVLHCDPSSNKEFVMVRAIGGGTKREYDWKKYFRKAQKNKQ